MSYPYGPVAPPPQPSPAYPLPARPARSTRWQVAVLVAVPLLAVASVAAVAGGGVAVSGHGTALAEPSTSGFPAPTDPAAAGSIVYTAPNGHYRVRLPAEPTARDEPLTFGAVSMTIHLAVVKSPTTEVGEEEINNASLPRSEYARTVRIAVGSFALSSGATINNQRATTFQGYEANTAEIITANGRRFTLLAFMYSSRRMFVLFAGEGAPFDALASSFVALG